jgi:hypothetical protein
MVCSISGAIFLSNPESEPTAVVYEIVPHVITVEGCHGIWSQRRLFACPGKQTFLFPVGVVLAIDFQDIN